MIEIHIIIILLGLWSNPDIIKRKQDALATSAQNHHNRATIAEAAATPMNNIVLHH